MKILPLLLIAAGAAGCGQKGPLVLPDAHTATPVVRPAPAVDQAGSPPAETATAPASPNPDAPDKKKRPE